MSPRAQDQWFVELLQECLPHSSSLEEALEMAGTALSMQPEPPVRESLDVRLSRDVWSKRAQKVLDQALKVSKALIGEARKELERILALPTRQAVAHGIVEFVSQYRLKLADVLNLTQLTSLLEGAREVARHLPSFPPAGAQKPPPPSLPPEDAQKLLTGLASLRRQEQEEVLYHLAPDVQGWAREALRARGAASLPPQAMPFSPASLTGSAQGIHWPILEEAIRDLSARNVVTRQVFDRLQDASRTKAFTVAGVEAEETLVKIRDAMADSMREGTSLEDFRSRVLDSVGEGTFLSEPHLETVYRAGVQSAFSDGQMNVLQHPYVRSGFPYATYEAIHDDRVRHNHLALESHGIEGSNVYRIDDPVFQLFRPPWDYNDRCAWIPITVRSAAEKGIKEARQWLDSGHEPSPPAFVAMPPFQPPPGWRRDPVAGFLSVRLALESLADFVLPEGHAEQTWRSLFHPDSQPKKKPPEPPEEEEVPPEKKPPRPRKVKVRTGGRRLFRDLRVARSIPAETAHA